MARSLGNLLARLWRKDDGGMREAYALHRAGDLEGAERAYGRLLEKDPGNADALFLLGEIASRTQRSERAIELLTQAVAANGQVAAFHLELAAALFERGRLDEAEQSYRRALELEPDRREALVDLAYLLLQRGQPQAAEQRCRQALQRHPDTVAAHVNLGLALQAQKRPGEAAAAYRQALALDPRCAQALCNLATLHLNQNELEEARRCAEQAVASAPDLFEAHTNLGNVLLQMRRPQDAVRSFREALRRDSGLALAHFNLGFALDLHGEFEQAMKSYDAALALEPQNAHAHVNRGNLCLLTEDYAQGWPEHEWRRRLPENISVHERFALPDWDGSPLAGRSLLVYGEQGLGDEIMYASCLPEILLQASRVIIDCDRRLEPIFRRSFPQANVRGGHQSERSDWLKGMGTVDCKVPIGSLPLHLRRSVADFPAHNGYLHAAPERVEHWRQALQQLGPGLKVGLSWRGGIQKTGRAWRSLELEELLPVLRLPGVRFVNLQYGDRARELQRLQREHGLEVVSWPQAIDVYDETAALVSALDLTLTVCTAIVHLAGALGRPAWVMAPLRPEARYGLRGEAMRWYPSVRMFRQSIYGAWQPVVEAVTGELRRLASRP